MQQATGDKKSNCKRYNFMNAASVVPEDDVDKNKLFQTKYRYV
jgi:hypothetical protein